MYALFLDDRRDPPDRSWVVVRSFEEAVAYVEQHGMPGFVSFDHDLGLGKTGFDFAKWLVERHLDGSPLPDDFTFTVQSTNFDGGNNIESLLRSFLRHVRHG